MNKKCVVLSYLKLSSPPISTVVSEPLALSGSKEGETISKTRESMKKEWYSSNFMFFCSSKIMVTENFVQPAIPHFDGHYDHWSMLMESFS